MKKQPLAFIDLKRQQQRLGSSVQDALARVLAHGSYILGPEVGQLEHELAKFCGAKHAISCSSGTDALILILMALGVRSGDAVFCPTFTFAATAECVVLAGGTPVFIDVEEESFNLDPMKLEGAIQAAKEAGLRPVGVISVDLFGRPADYDVLQPVCEQNKLWLLDDAAQSVGAKYKNRSIGTFGIATATSFFPAKPLGCYGDGGAIFTDDDDLVPVIKCLRVHGEGKDKYDNVRIGINGRLDTMQAAVLLEKLRIFPEEIDMRNEVAERYNQRIGNIVKVPALRPEFTSVWAQYTVRIPGGRRDAIAAKLKERGIPTGIYYARPLHQQPAYRDYPLGGSAPIAERLAGEVLSLPMHPYLEPDEQDYIVDALVTELAAS